MTVDLELAARFVAHLQHYAVGEASAVTAVTLTAALDLPNTEQGKRALRACAQHAIRSGQLVCSGQRGYFVPATPDESMRATARWRSEAYELMRRARKADQLTAERFALQDEPDPEPQREAAPLFALMEGTP